MPPPNQQRRDLLADAAIELLVESGVHGVTHRAVDQRAGLPAGTASNYFRSREALLVATAQRVVEQHQADMAAAIAHGPPPAPGMDDRERAIELIAGSLLLAAGPHRSRYLAIFELRLESLRRPALAAAIDELMAAMAAFTGGHHAEAGLAIPPAAVPALLVLYGGALFALTTGPAELVTPEAVRPLAVAIVDGGLASARA
ncbi:TetR/AcrR family transcriptional regulator [Catellatospora bangladeshensis]|uniref:TetR family transcriptional regulator n=1 Tax=Catellatospora bangladeshensis TaxID=310355 RepID=A0A8J3JKG5_9ACTN|nr:TetR/AcrR family transcriptional regulator [Catellatospora bangladeshensis]GIF82328.1 TetR family transcriptional regulator [Catellatospora bangladeshensis]